MTRAESGLAKMGTRAKRKPLCIAAANMVVTDDKACNLEKILDLVREAAQRGVDVLVLPELALQGYLDLSRPRNPRAATKQRRQLLAAAETIPGPSTDVIRDEVQRQKLFLQFGLAESDAARSTVFNSVVTIGLDGQLGTFRKIHNQFEFPYFDSGSELLISSTHGLQMASAICYDMCFPEFPRACALAGAVMILSSNAWASPETTKSQIAYYRYVYDECSRAASLFNQVWTVSSNQCQAPYLGGAQIIDPHGRLVSSLDGREGLVVHKADIADEILKARTGGFYGRNFLQERRPEVYGV